MAELFEDIEINRDPRWPMLLRLVGGSLVLHALVVAGALYVPVIRDTLAAANSLSGIEYGDEDYERTLIGQRAEMLAFDDGKFRYPPGYFAKVDPSRHSAETAETAALGPEAKIISVYKREPEEKPTPVPTPSPEPSPVASPSVSPAASPTPFQPAIPADVVASAGKLTDEQRDQKLNEIASQTNVERPPKINSRPFKDALARAKEMKDKGELDLSGSIVMTITADRLPDGSLINIKQTLVEGDPKLTAVALDFIAALSDSHALVFLKGAEHLKLTVNVNETDISVAALSEVESAERAKQMATGFNTLVFAAGFSNRDEAAVYRNTKIFANGREVVVNFSMTRAAAGAMLSKQLAAS
jgi:hypothetical protein